MSAKPVETVVESGAEVFIPLNKLKKSPKNARRTPHSEAAIEAYAASIAAKGILQNLVVEPELDGDGLATGFYFVTIGEGRRLAQLLRVKRRQTPAPTRAVSPVFRASSDPESSRPVMRLCRPALRAALRGGRSPSTRVALALATPGLADGQGRRRRCALRP